MPYKGLLGFKRMTNLFMNLFMGLVLGIVLLFLINDVSTMNAQSTARTYVQSLIMSVFVGYALGDFIPALDIGRQCAGRLHMKRGWSKHLVMSFIVAVINVTLILCICMIIVLFREGGIDAVAMMIVQTWLPAVLAGFVAISVFLPLAMKMAAAISGFQMNV